MREWRHEFCEKHFKIPISGEVIETATALRTCYRFLKTLDAIHLASASLSGCDVFLTHDHARERCPDLRVEVLALRDELH